MSCNQIDALPSEATISQRALLRELPPINIPEKSRSEWGIALLLFVASCLYLRAFYDYTNLNGDEGIVLQGAQRILNGEILYRDFFSFVTPGSHYWMALLFKIFGSSILVARAALLAYGGAFSVLTYLIARRVCSRWNSLLAVFPIVVVCLPDRFLMLHNWDSTFWALLALYCAVRFLESSHWAWAFGLGSLTAATCLFEQSKGAGLALGLTVGFCILVASDRCRVRIGRRRLIALLLGFALPFLLTVAYFGAHQCLPQMIADLLWPFHHYSAVNRAPYGYIERNWPALFHGSLGWRAFSSIVVSPFFIIPALPIFGLMALAYSALQVHKNEVGSNSIRYYVLVSAVLSGLLLSTLATGRPDLAHITLQAPLFCVVLGWMAEAAKTPFLRFVRSLGVSYVLASFTALGLAFASVPLAARYELQTRRGTLRTSAPYDAFEYIQSRVPAGEKILVYPYQPLYYYLTATYSVSRYEWVFPGMYDAAQFQEIIRELEGSRPRVVLFDPVSMNFLGGIWPRIPIQVAAARDPVNEYLFSHYRPCRTLAAPSTEWHIVFMMRNDLSCSPNASDPAKHR